MSQKNEDVTLFHVASILYKNKYQYCAIENEKFYFDNFISEFSRKILHETNNQWCVVIHLPQRYGSPMFMWGRGGKRLTNKEEHGQTWTNKEEHGQT